MTNKATRRLIVIALVLLTSIAAILTLCTACTVASKRPDSYKSTLRIYRCGELIEETVTELEVEDEIPAVVPDGNAAAD